MVMSIGAPGASDLHDMALVMTELTFGPVVPGGTPSPPEIHPATQFSRPQCKSRHSLIVILHTQPIFSIDSPSTTTAPI